MIKVSFITLGCPKNEVDSEYMMGILLNNPDFREASNIDETDIIVINTCGFIEDAKEESINTIIKAGYYKEKGKCRGLIVTGCLTQRYKTKIMDEMPEVDAILGTGNFDQLADTIKDVMDGNKVNNIDDPTFDYKPELPRRLMNTHYSYVKIAEGCNNNCTYCSIPTIRGPLTSRKIEDIYQEVSRLGKQGVKEIILVAQDTTRYGIDIYGKPTLVKLLKKLVSVKEIYWIRLMYTYPEHVSDQLIEIMSREEKICNYLDLPIQHSASKIRKKMNREGNRNEIIDLINKLRRKIPDISLRTSLIVGFPGETSADFENLINFVKQIKFARLGVFQYSREEGTAAARLPDQISEDLKEKRYNKLMNIQQEIARKNNQKLIDKKFEVIVDECYNKYVLARSQYDAPEIDNQIYIYNEKLNVGEIINCKINEAYEYDLVGEKLV